MRLPVICTLAVAALLLSGGASAAGNDVSVGQTPSFIAGIFSSFDTAFTAQARSAAAALMGFALRFLALSFTVMLVWRTVQWFLDAKHLASLMGTILNLMLHYSIVLVFLVPMGSSSGYQGTVSMISSLADSVATAASGGAFTSGSAAISRGIGSMLVSGFESLNTLNNIASARAASQTSIWSALTSGSVFTSMLESIAFVLAAFAILIATAYAGFQLAKVILYGVIMFALGAAVGPFFLGFLLLPPTRALGEHWFKFMLNAAFIKVVAFFMVGVIVSLGSSLIPPVTNLAQLQNLGAFAILSSYLALILVYLMVGWVLGQSISMAGSLFGGAIGGFAPGAGMASLAAGAAGVAVGASAAIASKLGGGAAAAKSATGTAASSAVSGGGAAGSTVAQPAASNTSSLGAPASSQPSAASSTSGSASSSGSSSNPGSSAPPMARSGAGKAFVAGAAQALGSGAVGAVKAAGTASKVGAAVVAGTKTGDAMTKAFRAGSRIFAPGPAGSAAGSSNNASTSNSSPPPSNSPEKQAYVNAAVEEAETQSAGKSQTERDKAVLQASVNAGKSYDVRQAAGNVAPVAVQGKVGTATTPASSSSPAGSESGTVAGSASGSAPSPASGTAKSNVAPSGSQGDSASFAAGVTSQTTAGNSNAPASKGQMPAQGGISSFGGNESSASKRISRLAQNRVNAQVANGQIVADAMARHNAATGSNDKDESSQKAGRAALSQHNEANGKSAYVNRAVEKTSAATASQSPEARDAAIDKSKEAAGKKFDSHPPQVHARYNQAMAAKQAKQGKE